MCKISGCNVHFGGIQRYGKSIFILLVLYLTLYCVFRLKKKSLDNLISL
jgi:hypothetical protein